MNNNELSAIMLTLLIAAIGMLALLSIAQGGDISPPCLTRDQAKAKFPGRWLYWHGRDHCWDDQRVFAKPDREAKAAKSTKLPIVLDADGNVVPISAAQVDEIQYRHEAEKRLQTCCWPPLPPFDPWKDRIDGALR